ncbi:MAG: VCBS repeat-containing protein [Flavobacteriaceae bacterium]|nr:VCBS repeat-containing protein [Flavobacteriaceae bacterium]
MYKIVAGGLFFLFWACDSNESPALQDSYSVHCGSCHLPPNINDLPKQLWSDQVLPEMASRLGLSTPDYDPMSGHSFEEQMAILESGIFPPRPVMDEKLFRSIVDYIITMAPESLERLPETPLISLEHYRQHPIDFPDSPLPSFTYLKIRNGKIEVGDLNGGFWSYDHQDGTWSNLYQFESPVVGSVQNDSLRWVLTVGLLNPSERSRGKLYEIAGNERRILLDSLHRPVYLDVSETIGKLDFTIAEFGHYSGRLSGLVQSQAEVKKQTLVSTPGAIRVLYADIDGDQLSEKLVLFAQGDERLVAFKHAENNKIQSETLLRFSPLSGVSWFEVKDLDRDGDLDIITVHGDNADKTYVQKPYHGVRVHSNDGDGRFTQVYNYPLNGATRVVATDWDMDGDQDLAVVAAFPDYSMETPKSFLLLENTEPTESQWQARSINSINDARWFLMDAGDLDGDGDQDIVLGVFNYHITPVPNKYLQEWSKAPIGLLILENTAADDTK